MVSLGVADYIQSRDPREAQYSKIGTGLAADRAVQSQERLHRQAREKQIFFK